MKSGPSGARTRTPVWAADFKSAAYADSAKGPRLRRLQSVTLPMIAGPPEEACLE
jgi:hypothetical protein